MDNKKLQQAFFFLQFWEGPLGPFRLGKVERETSKLGNLLKCIIMSFLVNKNKFSYYTFYCNQIEGERHHVACRRMAENGFAPPPREFCRHILSCRELKAESFKRCLHSVLWGVSL